MLERSKAVFSFLFKDKGFRITEDTGVDEQSFGNWLWEAASPDFKLRCINDRGFISVEIGPSTPKNEWFGLNTVRDLISGGDIMQVVEYDGLAKFIEQNYSKVANLFSGQNISVTVLKLRKLDWEWSRRRFSTGFFERPDKALLERAKGVFVFLLIDKGFRLTINSGIEPENLNNWLWEVESPDFKLRCINDRGVVSVDISPCALKNEWFGLEIIQVLILGGELRKIREYDDLARFLKEHYDEVVAIFNSGNISATVFKLHQLQREWSEIFWPRWVSSTVNSLGNNDEQR